MASCMEPCKNCSCAMSSSVMSPTANSAARPSSGPMISTISRALSSVTRLT